VLLSSFVDWRWEVVGLRTIWAMLLVDLVQP
jgi:hypothetical protein